MLLLYSDENGMSSTKCVVNAPGEDKSGIAGFPDDNPAVQIIPQNFTPQNFTLDFHKLTVYTENRDEAGAEIMDVKGAVKIAIDYIRDLFEQDTLSNIGLEEVTFNENEKTWEVTIGFSRPWDFPQPGIMTGLQRPSPKREYKIVSVDAASGKVKSVKLRELASA